MHSSYYHGKRVWITGASSGIGYAVGKALGALGARLALSGRNIANLERLKEEVHAITSEAEVILVPFDATDKKANLQAAKVILSAFDGVDIAFFNAGASEFVDLKSFNSDVFKRSIEINYLAIVYGVEAVLPMLRKSSCAQLVGMSSIASFGGMPGAEAYSAAKAAARNFLRGLAIDLRKEKIAVSCVCPGFIKTPMTDKNNFKMPMLMDVEKAAKIILKGIAAKQVEIHFPKLMSFGLKFLTSLPVALYTALMSRVNYREN